MKKTLLTLACLLCAWAAAAQDAVTFEFDGGISGPLKQKMEQQISRLLTAINTAESSGSDGINYGGVQFEASETASQTIGMLWNHVHFRTQDDDIYEPCLTRRQGSRIVGYQVRNIYMDMVPLDSTYQESKVQEFVVDLDAQGRISDVNIAMNKLQYQALLSEGKTVAELDRRSEILHHCEQFANAYRKMDLQFMQDIFSDDALIITGRVPQRQQSTVGMRRNPETGARLPQKSNATYTVRTKAEYLSELTRIFNNQRRLRGGYINVEFSDFKVVRHPTRPNFYGVTTKQRWSSKGYQDEGIVFLVWDFTNEESPKIQVRTWQMMSTPEREIFTLNSIDFDE